MIHVEPINEGSSIYLEITFRDRNEILAAPIRAWLGVVDAVTQEVLQPMAELQDLAATMDVVIPAAVTLIPPGRNAKAVMVTVVGQYGQATDRVTQMIEVPILPVHGVPV